MSALPEVPLGSDSRGSLVPLGAKPADEISSSADLREGEAPLPASQRVVPAAADMTPERMLRAQADAPPSGWRRAAFLLTRGLINLDPARPTCSVGSWSGG
jgi:hypothetical protein